MRGSASEPFNEHFRLPVFGNRFVELIELFEEGAKSIHVLRNAVELVVRNGSESSTDMNGVDTEIYVEKTCVGFGASGRCQNEGVSGARRELMKSALEQDFCAVKFWVIPRRQRNVTVGVANLRKSASQSSKEIGELEMVRGGVISRSKFRGALHEIVENVVRGRKITL